nr:MAG TPA: hypothetical protein [Microviridae sp.]
MYCAHARETRTRTQFRSKKKERCQLAQDRQVNNNVLRARARNAHAHAI